MNFGDNSDIIDIGIETLDDNGRTLTPSSNFGSGIEMFMNAKSLKNVNNGASSLDSVDDIENELNSLSIGL
jgi:hypothetical protein